MQNLVTGQFGMPQMIYMAQLHLAVKTEGGASCTPTAKHRLQIRASNLQCNVSRAWSLSPFAQRHHTYFLLGLQDELIDAFGGGEKVAEMTGRKMRMERVGNHFEFRSRAQNVALDQVCCSNDVFSSRSLADVLIASPF